ncbi:hypothetical protein [Aquirufa nivalisilvae]|uniref:hypothetical protein n=1 Tax=Aquirufa nivalisilvae TaxID=2516557 RepID=UPI001375E3C3|nr:hypothetical protein [Aquirufa nivalisilvae]
MVASSTSATMIGGGMKIQWHSNPKYTGGWGTRSHRKWPHYPYQPKDNFIA